MYKTLAFTGPRPQKLSFGYNYDDPKCKALKKYMKATLIDFIEKEGVRFFVSGMALGIDQIAAQLVLELKPYYPEIKLEAALPCIDQERLWPQECKITYSSIIDKCDVVHMCIDGPYKPGCMRIRNEYMVNKADFIIAVWDGQEGGTASTVRYAKSKNKKIFIITSAQY